MSTDAQLSDARSLHRAGRLGEAEALYRQVLAREPQNLSALCNLGAVCLDLRKLDHAQSAFEAALRIDPQLAEVHNCLGILASEEQRLDDALAHFERAALLHPEFDGNLAQARAAAHTHRGMQLAEVQRWPDARACFEAALAARPDHLPALGNLGNTLRSLGELNAAADCYERVLRVEPRLPEAHYNLGLIASQQDNFSLAAAACRRAIELQPRYAEAHYQLGSSLLRLGQADEAVASFDRAIGVRRDYAEAHFGRGFALLLLGKLDAGWPEYEWRLNVPGVRAPHAREPRWNGESLIGKRIALCGEQGAGDTLQFIRYARLLKQQGAEVVVRCPASLARLVATCSGVDRVASTASGAGRCDFHVPLLSLPGAFGTTLETIPDAVPYLCPASESIDRWRDELAPVQEFKVGIAWQGNPEHDVDRFRSIPLECFASIARMPSVQAYSVQFGRGREQIALAAMDWPVIDLGDRLGDFHETAAILRNLDLVITCDSAPAHLAGALGIPVWVALANVPDWRWLLGRNDSPWYPTMRLFRQPSPGDWRSVFARIERDLEAVVSLRRPSGDEAGPP